MILAYSRGLNEKWSGFQSCSLKLQFEHCADVASNVVWMSVAVEATIRSRADIEQTY